MASRNNGYYRDPALAQAFNNISAMFGPPSGADAAGFATAAAKKAEAERLAWLFSNSADPTAAARAALTGVQTYGNTPEGFMKSDATTRRGQDVTAATSRENNIRDNSRQMAQTRYGAIGEGQILPEMPVEVAQLYGLPAAPAQTGVVKLSQNQTATLPTGEMLTGINRPQTMDEWQAQQAERQRQAGLLPDNAITDLIMGKQTPAYTLGPDGKTPVYANMGEAIRKQLPAVAAPSATPVKRETGTAFVDGRQVPVTRAPDGMQWQMPDGAPVPEGAKVTNMATPQGSLEQIGMPTTANNTAANNQSAEVTRALSVLDLYEELINKNPGAIGLVGAIRGTAQNLAASAGDLAKSFGARAPQLGEAAAALQEGMRGVAPDFFDPSIPQADFLQGTLAYALARTENPSGEVSRQAFERALDRVKGGGLLANTEAARAAIAANRQVLQSQLRGIQTLRGQQPGRTDAGFQPPPPAPGAQQPVATERWERGPDGQLRKVQ